MATLTTRRPRTRSARTRPPSALLAALSGLLAAAAALAAGELAAGLVPDGRSPVITVGDRVIDLVPPPVKDFAISTFGTADKPALVVGILVLTALLGTVLGLAAVRRLAVGAAGLVLFGLVGVAAALAEGVGVVPAALVNLAAVVAGIVVLAALIRRLRAVDDDRTGPALPASDRAGIDRRAFLRGSAVVAGLAVAAGATGRWLQGRASAATSRMALMLPTAANPLPSIPSTADLDIDGLVPYVTPNADFYRIDTALSVPQVAVEDWTLRISGMVDRPLELSFDDLISRALVEADVTLACVSNEVGGNLIGNARWLGVRLDELLAEAGVQPGATQIVGRSVDGFTAGFPTQIGMDGREALIAVGMNGEPLPLEHGFPARLVVPGLYGYVSATKWLSEIELTTMDAFDAYWIPRGWAKEAPIKTQSRIDVPAGLATIPPGRTAVAGVAWAQTRGIERVEVQVDDGPWAGARLADEVDVDTWRQWVWEWDATPGNHTLRVRATDGTGETQTEERARPVPDGAAGWHNVSVRVSAG